MIISIIMLAVSLMVLRFYSNIKHYGDESNFFVAGKWKPGLIGMFIAVGFSLMFSYYGIAPWLPIILFLVSILLAYRYLSPILQVNGDEVKCTTAKGRVMFNKADLPRDMDIMVFVIRGKEFVLHRDSVNYDRFKEWLKTR